MCCKYGFSRETKHKELVENRSVQFMRKLLFATSVFLLPVLATSAETASGTASVAIAVDASEGSLRIILPKDIAYNPRWIGGGDDAYVVLEKVEHAGMHNAVTSVVMTSAAGVEGIHSYLENKDQPCFRLIHRVYAADGTEIGKPLVRDIAIGVGSSPSEEVFVDSREGVLREAIASGKAVNLTYDTAWATNAASARISAVRLKGEDGVELETNTIFAVTAPKSGVKSMQGFPSGWWKLLCCIEGASDDCEPLIVYSSEAFKIKPGFILFVR